MQSWMLMLYQKLLFQLTFYVTLPNTVYSILTASVLVHTGILSPAASSLIATYIQGTYPRKYTMPAHAAASLALEYSTLIRNLKI